MTGWILVALVAVPLIVGVLTLRRRVSRARPTEGGTTKPAETTTSRPSVDAGTTPDVGAEVLEHLRRLEAKGSPGLAAHVLEIFLQDTSTRLNALRDAVARRDGDLTYRVAHTLQGSASMVGAASVARSCAELVKAVRSGSFDRCEALIAELDAGVEAIRRVVTE